MTQPIKVLLVEDNPADADLVTDLLEDAGGPKFVVTRAGRISEALESLEREGMSCLLLDLGLPDAEGMESVVSIRSVHPNVPIVVLTGRDDEQIGIEALREGAQDYLVKGKVDGDAIGRAIRYSIERKKLDAAKSEFIARAAHELRTPLAVLAGLGETLGERYRELSPERIEQGMQALSRQGQRARALISNLLDLSQLELGKLSFHTHPTPLAAMVQQSVETMGATAPSLDMEIAPEVRVLADPGRLEQVLVNLLTNVTKYGGGKARLTAATEEGRVCLRIQDQGPGVPDDVEARLFEPFARGSNTSEAEGSGLGLPISRGLAESMGGDLWHEKTEEGATFVLELPEARGKV